jgi:hypothetical protein
MENHRSTFRHLGRAYVRRQIERRSFDYFYRIFGLVPWSPHLSFPAAIQPVTTWRTALASAYYWDTDSAKSASWDGGRYAFGDRFGTGKARIEHKISAQHPRTEMLLYALGRRQADVAR